MKMKLGRFLICAYHDAVSVIYLTPTVLAFRSSPFMSSRRDTLVHFRWLRLVVGFCIEGRT